METRAVVDDLNLELRTRGAAGGGAKFHTRPIRRYDGNLAVRLIGDRFGRVLGDV
jgi:hypothetical protein